MERISAKYPIIFCSLATVGLIVCDIVPFFKFIDDEFVIAISILTLLVSIPAIITSAIVHYKCWKAIPPDIARTSPGMAVGLLFVPFFNFYWCFVSYVGLAEDSAKALGSRNSSRNLGIALGILSITQYTFATVGPLLIPAMLAGFVIWLIFTLKMVDAANKLNARATTQTPEPA